MSRIAKSILLLILVLLILACSTITRPLNQAQDLAATAQSLATVMPVETLKAVVTQIPVGTLEALPSMAPSLEALGTGMPDFQGYFDPQGTPVFEWKGVPVMPQATAGQEFPEGSTYSYKVDATVKEVQDYYNTELEKLGWTSTFNMPGGEDVAVQVYQKDNNFLTVSVMTNVSREVVVILTIG